MIGIQPYVCICVCMCVSTSTGTAIGVDKDISCVFLECSFPFAGPPGRRSLPFTFHSHLQSSAQVFSLAVWSPMWFTTCFHIYSILLTTLWEEKLGRHSLHFADEEIDVSWCSHEPGESALYIPAPCSFHWSDYLLSRIFICLNPVGSATAHLQPKASPALPHPWVPSLGSVDALLQHFTRWVAKVFVYFSDASPTPNVSPSANHFLRPSLPHVQCHVWHLEKAQ